MATDPLSLQARRLAIGLPAVDPTTMPPGGGLPPGGGAPTPNSGLGALTITDPYRPQNPVNPTDIFRAQGMAKFGVGARGAPTTGPPPVDPGPAPPPAGAPTPSSYLEDLWKQYGGAFFGPTYSGSNMAGLTSYLSKPGEAEQFYQHALNTDTDPYYQRLQQQGADSLDQQMQARGHFNSGAAVAGLGNFESGLKAAQYHDLGQLAQGAEQEGQARAGLLGQLGTAADNVDTSRLNAAFGTAGTAQQLNTNRVNDYITQQLGLDASSAKMITDVFSKAGDISSADGRAAIEAQIKGILAQAGGTQAQQDLAMKGIESLITAIAA